MAEKLGVHADEIAAWKAAAEFGGMRDHGGDLWFSPRLPDAIGRLAFGVLFRESHLRIEVKPERATYTLREGDEPIRITYWARTSRFAPAPP